jgi:hypothetical protein
MFLYLDKLKAAGKVPMLSAISYLRVKFDIEELEATLIVFEWMETHGEVSE